VSDYNRLLCDSIFALCPAVRTNSLRLWEALATGAIPVLLGHSALPRRTLPPIDWDDIVLRVSDPAIPDLPACFAPCLSTSYAGGSARACRPIVSYSHNAASDPGLRRQGRCRERSRPCRACRKLYCGNEITIRPLHRFLLKLPQLFRPHRPAPPQVSVSCRR